MNRPLIHLLAIGALVANTVGFSAGEELPKAVQACLSAAASRSQIDTKVKPYFLVGDFYGDGKPSYAVLIQNDNKRGILICNSSRRKEEHVGAGLPLNGMVDLNFSAWRLYPRGKVARGAGEGPPPILHGDAIWIEWEESASALVYWNGRKFAWYQQGD